MARTHRQNHKCTIKVNSRSFKSNNSLGIRVKVIDTKSLYESLYKQESEDIHNAIATIKSVANKTNSAKRGSNRKKTKKSSELLCAN